MTQLDSEQWRCLWWATHIARTWCRGICYRLGWRSYAGTRILGSAGNA